MFHTGWREMKWWKFWRRGNHEQQQRLKQNGLGLPIISSFNKKAVVVDTSYGSKKKEKNSNGQKNIDKGVQTLTIVTTELMILEIERAILHPDSISTNYPPFDKADPRYFSQILLKLLKH